MSYASLQRVWHSWHLTTSSLASYGAHSGEAAHDIGIGCVEGDGHGVEKFIWKDLNFFWDTSCGNRMRACLMLSNLRRRRGEGRLLELLIMHRCATVLHLRFSMSKLEMGKEVRCVWIESYPKWITLSSQSYQSKWQRQLQQCNSWGFSMSVEAPELIHVSSKAEKLSMKLSL